MRFTLPQYLLLTTLLLTASCKTESPSLAQSRQNQQLDTFLAELQTRFDIPGLAVAITDTSRTIYMNAFGVRNLDTGETLRPEHVFHMASVSKPFVATAIMQLVEQGKMDLHAPVTTYLPYFKLDDDRYQQITILQMLTHTSGMPDESDYQWDQPALDEDAAERYVRSLSDKKLLTDPGTDWAYSNIAFDVLGDVIAKVSGQSFEAYISEHILQPLGMDESSFLKADINPALATSPHVGWGHMTVSETYPYNRRHAPSSTLNASVKDMAEWAIFNLNEGQHNNQQLLQPANFAQLWHPWTSINETRQNGLSWFLDAYKGIATVEHGGRDTGYTSYFTLLPELGYGIVIACNDYLGPVVKIRNGIIDILQGLEPEVGRPSISDAFDKVYKQEGFEAAKTQYHQLAQTAQAQYNFGWEELNGYGFFHLYGLNEDAVALDAFMFNATLYPEMAEVHKSLGEGYQKAGNLQEARQAFEKALSLNPEDDALSAKLHELSEDED